MSRTKNTAPRNKTSKGDALDRWTPNKDFHSNYDRIFGKKQTYWLVRTTNDFGPVGETEFPTYTEAEAFLKSLPADPDWSHEIKEIEYGT